MRTYRNIILPVVVGGLLIMRASCQDNRDLKAQLETLQRQSASLAEQIELLQRQIERRTDPTLEMASYDPDPAAEPSGPRHGFFERKPGDKLTFYVPNGELTIYGNLDVSFDVTTKGLGGMAGPDGKPPVGAMGWMPALSTNLSYVGVRGFESVKNLPFNFIYQFETQLDIAGTSGSAETNSNQSNVVKSGLTSRNTYIGIANRRWGSLMFGKTDAPYKSSTARFNPFSAMIGDYQVVMANTGGDNRVEFGTRLDHSIWYESPNWRGFVLDALVSPGQNRADNSDNIAAGESDCTGGNVPGSGGVTPLTCSDGAFSTATSVSLSYTRGRLYATGAYERHNSVNRASDVLGMYSPSNAYAQVLLPQDVADEDAGKVGVLYLFPSKTTLGGIFETLHRYVPPALEFQNERQRLGTWLVAGQQLTRKTSMHFGWAHAFRAPGDPGQHNDSNLVPPGGESGTDATAGAHADNSANRFTVAFKNQLNKNLAAYLDWAFTANGPAAHYDLGAGGRSVTTDCHDAFDATGGLVGSNPHCWAGGQIMGISAGLNLKF